MMDRDASLALVQVHSVLNYSPENPLITSINL